MKERAIRVIKRRDVEEKASVAAKDIKSVKASAIMNTANAVSHWIFEREENRGDEKIFSDKKISSWGLSPDTTIS
jgi:hypothetical protein